MSRYRSSRVPTPCSAHPGPRSRGRYLQARGLVALAALGVAVPQDLPAPVERALAVLEEARAVARNAGEGIWPGFDLETIPIAIYTQDEAYLVHQAARPAGFEPLENDVVSTPVLRGPRTAEMNANTSGTLGGAVTAFVSIESLGSGPITAKNVGLVVHEAGHAFRARAPKGGAPKGGAPRWPAENAMLVSEYPADSASNNAWGRVEGALLADALEAGDAAGRLELVRDYLAVRARRQADLDPAIVRFEERLELNEGLAEYFARRAVELAGAAYEPTPAAAARGLSAQDYGANLAELLGELRRVNVGGAGAERQRFYATGPALGLLLDRLDPSWKEQVEAGGKDLREVLEAAVGTDEDAGRLERVAAERGFESILRYELAASRAAAARKRKRLDEILGAPGPLLVLDLSHAGGAGGVDGFDPLNVIAVDSSVRVHSRMLSLSFTGGSARFERPVVQDLGRGLAITTLPPDAEVELDPEGRSRISGAGLEVSCQGAGFVEDGELLLLGPGAREEELDPAPIRALVESARAAAREPLPAAPFEVEDLAGAVHRQPSEPPRRTALVFFSAAAWARPSRRFASEVLEELRPSDLNDEGPRLLFVASQCTREELDAFLGGVANREAGDPRAGSHVVHDADRSLARSYDVTSYPTVIWISPEGTIARVADGYSEDGVRDVLSRLRDG